MLTIKRHLIYIYGRYKDHCSEESLAKKIKYCEEILLVCDVVMPGKTTEENITIMQFNNLRTDKRKRFDDV